MPFRRLPLDAGGGRRGRLSAGSCWTFTPIGVAAGDYSLRVRVRDPASGRVGESFQSVRVE